jgi:hypothetical protein
MILLMLSAAAAGVVFALAYWGADQAVALRRGSPFVVYLLFDRRGWAFYVGQTGDMERRYREHLRGDDPWRAEIAGYSVARHCRTARQARRCEARAIRGVTVCSRFKVCPPIHNEVLFGHAGRVGALVWAGSWLLLSVLFEGPRFHRRNPRLPLFVDPAPMVDSEPSAAGDPVDVRSWEPARQIDSQTTHPSHPVGVRDLLTLIADTPELTAPDADTRDAQSPTPPRHRKGRAKLSPEERDRRRRESNARSQAKRRAAKRADQ